MYRNQSPNTVKWSNQRAPLSLSPETSLSVESEITNVAQAGMDTLKKKTIHEIVRSVVQKRRCRWRAITLGAMFRTALQRVLCNLICQLPTCEVPIIPEDHLQYMKMFPPQSPAKVAVYL